MKSTISELYPTLEDYHNAAHSKLDRVIYDYIAGGAGDEVTCRSNLQDLLKLALVPLTMRDVSTPDLGWQWQAKHVDFPIGISPTAFHGLVTEEAEAATARAASALRLPYIVSSMSGVDLGELAKAGKSARLWLQLYLFKDKGVTKELITLAEDSGFEAIVVTAGCPVPGLRERNLRNQFTLPDHISPAHFPRVGHGSFNNPITGFDNATLDPAATWDDIAWLRAQTRLPVLIKGILNPTDVDRVIDCGLAGLMVSNHGGRQLDTSISSIAALPQIVEVAEGRLNIFVDGGFRRGTDLLKALTLGADAVFLGRPVLWALAVGGEAGLTAMINGLANELSNAMQLVGCQDIAELRKMADQILMKT